MNTKFISSILLIFCIGSSEKAVQKNQSVGNEIPPIDKSLALKPPMGWISWNCFLTKKLWQSTGTVLIQNR